MVNVLNLQETRQSKTFTEQIDILADYIGVFKHMWPFYWLEAVAVRDPKASIWRLCYISLVGRWDNRKPIPEISDKNPDRGSAIVAISQLIDIDRTWEILASLRADGTIELLPDITASAIPGLSSLTFYCQESITFRVPKVVTDVAESADWRYLYAHGYGNWSSDNIRWLIDDGDDNEFEAEKRIMHASQSDLYMRGLRDFESFAATRLGLSNRGSEITCSIKDFNYNFDLPLALRVERGIPDRSINSLPLTIYCRRPLTLESLNVSVGDIWLANNLPLAVEIECSSEDGWSVGSVVVPYDCGRVWFKFENLTKALPYEIPIPTPEDQVTEVLGSMYHVNSTDEGKLTWRKHLLDERGANFEIALLNAIARFGIPVLFAGQMHKGDQAGGTATPGYDLVVMNHVQRRAALISAKGSINNPSQEDCEKLLNAVEAIQQTLQGWSVTGIIACHATNNKLGLARKRTDLRVWSREDLEVLFQADKRESIDYLLWTLPDAQALRVNWSFRRG